MATEGNGHASSTTSFWDTLGTFHSGQRPPATTEQISKAHEVRAGNLWRVSQPPPSPCPLPLCAPGTFQCNLMFGWSVASFKTFFDSTVTIVGLLAGMFHYEAVRAWQMLSAGTVSWGGLESPACALLCASKAQDSTGS